MNDKKITIGIATTIFTIIITVIVSSGLTMLLSYSADRLSVNALAAEVKEIKANYMPTNLSVEKWTNNEKAHQEINKKLDDIYRIVYQKLQ